MNYIQHVLENPYVQEQVISVNENVIGYMVQSFPVLTKDIVCYVNNNKRKFVKKDIKTTQKNIRYFGEQVTLSYMITCSIILESELSESQKIQLVSEIDTQAILANTKSIAKDIGKGVVDAFQNPLTQTTSKVHMLSWFGSGLFSGTVKTGGLLTGGVVGSMWSSFLMGLGIPASAMAGATGSLVFVSTGLLAVMVIMFVSMRLMTRKDALLVYALNSNLQKFMKQLKYKGFKEEVSKIETKSSVAMFRVKAFTDCQDNAKCEILKNPIDKKDCVLNCFFNFFIEKELSKIIDTYIKYLKSVNVSTKGITSLIQLVNRPLPESEEAVQMAASSFGVSLYKVLKKLYKEDISKQTKWISKINKIVTIKSKSGKT
jgi:hypothetical protein